MWDFRVCEEEMMWLVIKYFVPGVLYAQANNFTCYGFKT